MALIHREEKEGCLLGIWQINEPPEFFTDQLSLGQEEIDWLNSIKGSGRRLEWLGSRYLLKTLAQPHAIHIEKDEFGKPHLVNDSRHISISHSHGYCSVIFAPANVGIDIQWPVDKISRIKDKFLSAWERHTLHPTYDLEKLHRYWSAKECIYKIYGRKSVDFRRHMTVDLANELGYLHMEHERLKCKLTFTRIEDLYVTYGLQMDIDF